MLNFPISRLVAHEETIESNVQRILRNLVVHGQDFPIVVECSGVILDGHHRVEAARRLGWETIKAEVVDYWEVDLVDNWGVPMDRLEVLERAHNGFLYPPKTTKHYIHGRRLIDYFQ